MTPYHRAVNAAMLELAKDDRVVFVGQSCRYDGAAIYETLDGVPMEKRIEMPVVEDFQLGYCIGLSLVGKIPVCIYPRMDFMMLAMNQLVLHLDKIPLMSPFRPKVIVRCQVVGRTPLDAGVQHTNDYVSAFHLMLRTVKIKRVVDPKQTVDMYQEALFSPDSHLMVEYR